MQSYSITATGGEDQTPVTLPYWVLPKGIDIDWTGDSFTYDGKPHAPVASVAEGSLVGNDTCEITVCVPDAAAGAVEPDLYMALAELGNTSYFIESGETKLFTITPRPVVLQWGSADLTYNGSKQAPDLQTPGLIAGDDVAVTVTGAQKDAGIYDGDKAAKAVLTGTKAGNYVLPQDVTCDFFIKPKQLDIVNTVAADKTYDKTDTATISYDGELRGVAEEDSLSFTASGVFEDEKAGTRKSVTVYYTVNGDAVENYYMPSPATVTADISPKTVTVIWGNADFIYNGNEQAPGAQMTGFISGDDVEISVSGAQKDAGTYNGDKAAKAVLTGEDAGNYALPDNSTCAFTIAQKQLTAGGTAANDKTYDGTAEAALSSNGILSGVVTGETVTLGASGSFADANAGAVKTVNVSYTIGGNAAKNYIKPVDCTVTAAINPKPVSISWGTDEFTYDADAHVPDAGTDDFADGDDVALTASGSAVDAGSYTATAALSGSKAGNYALPDDPTCGFTIKPMPLGNDALGPVAPETYTGSAVTPAVTVSSSLSASLTEGTDYTLSFSDNVDAGTAKVTATFKGNYTGTGSVQFTISKNTGNSFTTLPEAGTDLGTDGSKAVTLLAAPAEAQFGTVMYSIDGGESWSEELPQVSRPGEYSVMYKVDGTDNYNGLSGSVEVSVSDKASHPGPAPEPGRADPVTTTDEGCRAEVTIIGSAAEIIVTDRNGNAKDAGNVTITSPAQLIALGVRTAEIRMTETLTVEIDLESATGGKKDSVITVDNEDGIIVVRRDGVVIFNADVTDIADRIARLVHDGKTVKAIDADGRIIAEFDLY